MKAKLFEVIDKDGDGLLNKVGVESHDSGDSGMYPGNQRGPPENGKSLYKAYSSWVFMGYNLQESLENTINTMGTLLGVHPIVP